MVETSRAYINFAIQNSIYLSLILLLLGWGELSSAIDSDVTIGISIGVIVSILYCFISHLVVLKWNFHKAVLNVFSRGFFPAMSLKRAGFIFIGVIYEEIVWRVYLLSEIEAGYETLGVSIMCVFFFLIHFSVFTLNAKLKTLELFLFSITISLLWVYARNLYAVCVFHYIRNYISMNIIIHHSSNIDRNVLV